MVKISWSKLELFKECPRCFYYDVKLKVRRPSSDLLTFYNSVDASMKSEMDHCRASNTIPEVISQHDHPYRLSNHPRIGEWRSISQGLKFNWSDDIVLLGLIDDLWEDERGKFVVVDFKSTVSQNTMQKLPPWHEKMQRQLSFYAYLFMKNGFDVHPKGVIFYVIGQTGKNGLFGKMNFDYQLFELPIETGWIENTVKDAIGILEDSIIPKHSSKCPFCTFEMGRGLKSEKID